MKLVTIFLTILNLLIFSSAPTPAIALSEYGRKCDDNSDCKKCRDESPKCITCMHNCWNMYGPAERSPTASRIVSRREACRLKRAKWCNAQCWDPDDRTQVDYVSTKPHCHEISFPKYFDGKRPW